MIQVTTQLLTQKKLDKLLYEQTHFNNMGEDFDTLELKHYTTERLWVGEKVNWVDDYFGTIRGLKFRQGACYNTAINEPAMWGTNGYLPSWLSGVWFYGKYIDCEFNVQIMQSHFHKCILITSVFKDTLREVTFNECKFYSVYLDAYFKECEFDSCIFVDIDFNRGTFSHRKYYDTKFINCKFIDCKGTENLNIVTA